MNGSSALHLLNKRVVLTGAAGGIGRCVAARLARIGVNLLLVDLDTAALRSLGDELRQPSLAVDLRQARERDRLADAIQARWRALDGLVNCAGITAFGLQDAVSDHQVESVIAVNLTMPVLLTRRLLPLMESGHKPVIVIVGSVFGHIGFPGFAAYSASKFGLHGFTEALRRELSTGPIRVAWISPRATQTGLNAGPVDAMNSELRVHYDRPESVAKAIAGALASPRRDRVLGFPEKFFARLNQVLPSLVDRSLKGQLPVVRKYSQQQKENSA